MKRHCTKWQWSLFVRAAAIAAIVGCGHTEKSLSSPEAATVALAECGETCVLFKDSRPFDASHALTDSSDATFELGRFTLRGAPGDRVGLLLRDLNAELNAVESRVPVIVEVDGARSEYSLVDLLQERVVYTFSDAGQVTVRYSIPRATPSISNKRWTLAQLLGGARIEKAQNQWLAPALSLSRAAIQAAGTQTCTVNTAAFSACGTSGTISPFAASAPSVQCVFSSAPTTGPSVTITITLSQAASQVGITICDADYPGNAMTAYDANGAQVGTFAFTGDGKPGVLTVQGGAITANGIRRVVLTAAPNDYVAYQDFNFTVAGPGDSLILSPLTVARKPGQHAKFSAKSHSGKAVTITGWAWVPTTGQGLTAPNCGASSSCDVAVYESGKIVVTGTETGGITASGSATLTVTPCPPLNDNDSRMNDPGFIKSLVELVDLKGNERGGQVYSNPLTGEWRVMEMKNVAPIPCRQTDYSLTAIPLSPPPAGFVRDDADGHSHPWPANKPFSLGCDPTGKLQAGIGPSGGFDPVTHMASGDYPWESQRMHTGYLADADGLIFRWGSGWEPDFMHPTPYLRASDANGYSVCLTQLSYP